MALARLLPDVPCHLRPARLPLLWSMTRWGPPGSPLWSSLGSRSLVLVRLVLSAFSGVLAVVILGVVVRRVLFRPPRRVRRRPPRRVVRCPPRPSSSAASVVAHRVRRRPPRRVRRRPPRRVRRRPPRRLPLAHVANYDVIDAGATAAGGLAAGAAGEVAGALERRGGRTTGPRWAPEGDVRVGTMGIWLDFGWMRMGGSGGRHGRQAGLRGARPGAAIRHRRPAAAHLPRRQRLVRDDNGGKGT